MIRGAQGVAIAGLTLLMGCSTKSAEDAGTSCFFGDPAARPELSIVHVTTDGGVELTTEGAEVPLIKPPQGGKILLIGARALHLDGCPIEISAVLRDPCTQLLVGTDQRRVLLRPSDAGLLEAPMPIELADFANVAACPSAAAARDIEGELYRLEVRLTDSAGRTAEASARVRPVCAEAEFLDECLCECDGDYRLGDVCATDEDAGVSSETCPRADAST